jgi:hypothetical protein
VVDCGGASGACQSVDIVVEAVVENMKVKKTGFLRALHDGADYVAIDRVMESFGWPMGPAVQPGGPRQFADQELLERLMLPAYSARTGQARLGMGPSKKSIRGMVEKKSSRTYCQRATSALHRGWYLDKMDPRSAFFEQGFGRWGPGRNRGGGAISDGRGS